MIKKSVLGIIFSVGLALSAHAQTHNLASAIGNLNWQVGANTHRIETSNAVISTKDDEAFLQGKDAQDFMRLSEGHDRFKPDALIVKLGGSMAESVVLFQYAEIGYVKTDDWERNIDPDQIIRVIRKNTEMANKAKAAGYEKIYVDGWVEKPYLDRQNAIVYWAVQGHSESGQQFINAKALKLGRKGMSSLVWVGAPEQFHGATRNLKPALQAYTYQDGFRYADYRTGVDTVAVAGVGAIAYKMLTGKSTKTAITAGAGIFAIFAALAKKFLFLLLVPFVFVWKAIKRLFSIN